MTRHEKQQVVADLQNQLEGASSFYIADSSELDVATVNKLRGLCHERNVEFKVVKNTLLIKALDALEQDYSPLYDILKGGSSVMLSETASAPAKLIKDFPISFSFIRWKACLIGILQSTFSINIYSIFFSICS